ncbi:putative oxidoreductase CipA [Xylariaceae sp. FL0255]|nr:putative oxidoreductase CipA [Xylariaceae sp. FL0255]
MASSIPKGDKNSDSGNYLKNVAIFGATGRSGRFIADALVKKGKHRVTVITRPESTRSIPPGVHNVKKVQLEDYPSIVEALKGQHALVITLSAGAAKGTEEKLMDAAVEAGVQWVMPNDWGCDETNSALMRDSEVLSRRRAEIRRHMEEAARAAGGRTNWIGMCCGFWYEFSLAGTEARYGFDFEKKSVTFFDDGLTLTNTSTWPQVGLAVANLLSLKILPDSDDDVSPCLSRYANRFIFVSSFYLTQKDMFESVLRVTGDSRDEWKISREPSVDRYQRGVQMVHNGQRVGFLIAAYARIFCQDGVGDFNDKLDNEALGLPEESLDNATREAVRMALAGETNAVK